MTIPSCTPRLLRREDRFRLQVVPARGPLAPAGLRMPDAAILRVLESFAMLQCSAGRVIGAFQPPDDCCKGGREDVKGSKDEARGV
jgi:hypothetical protein